MNSNEEMFLKLFADALNQRRCSDNIHFTQAEWDCIWEYCRKERIFPLIYESVYQTNKETNSRIRKTLKNEAVDLTVKQAECSSEFLSIYCVLKKNKLSPAVIDGIPIMELYENFGRCLPNDNTILIEQKDEEQYHRILTEYGLLKADHPDIGDNESVYYNRSVRIALKKNTDQLADLLNEQLRKQKIYKIPVNLPDVTGQLIYMILRLCGQIKSSYIKLLTISDINLFSMKYCDEINWKLVKTFCSEHSVTAEIRSIYMIGMKQLFDEYFPKKLIDIWELKEKPYPETDERIILLCIRRIFDPDDKWKYEKTLDDSWKDELQKQYKEFGSKDRSYLKKIYKKSYHSSLAWMLSYLFRAVSFLEYHVLQFIGVIRGARVPTQEEKALMRENVTFIFKSFERQKLAKGLCRNITDMYPGVSVIVADDSHKPLEITNSDVKVIQLPFNTGLSAGLHAALKEVRTPYVMRMDDDELLTNRSNVHEELKWLMKHPEIDLIGFGHTTAIRLHSPEFNFNEYINNPITDSPLPLKKAHMTVIDPNHIVLSKVANIYLARTEKLREVGFDPNIHVIDHHDFFWRAAGKMISVIAKNTLVFHRHNPYAGSYNSYRSDYGTDLEYIKRKRQSILKEVSSKYEN